MEYRYHLYPNKLNSLLKDTVQKLDEEKCDWEQILLGYGLCSNGVDGLVSQRSRIVMPKVDDCIALFLGSSECFREEQRKEPGTYYLTKGWIECKADSLAVMNRQHEWTEDLDPETAEWFARDLVKNYSRLVLVDTGSYDITPFAGHAEEVARVFGQRFEIISGSIAYLETLLNGPWDSRFIVVEAREPITKDMFAGNF
ncbi:MAG: DUF1638 domain-containing protein [Synergistaceae bacterium]|nr:DUF1638 domain-containing protein [Synergistaceae bacterium]